MNCTQLCAPQQGISWQPASPVRRAGLGRPSRMYYIAARAGKTPAPTTTPQEAVEVPTYLQPPPPPPETQYYQAVPQYPIAPPPPAAKASSGSSLPPLIWIGIGILIANGFNFIMGLVKGGPQKMQQMAMEQMMNQMMKQTMGGKGGANPFGGPGGANPFGAAGGNPFAAGGAGFPFPPPPTAASAAGGFPSGFPSSGTAQPPIDTTATAAPPKGAAATATPPPPAAASSSTSGSASKKKSAFVDVDSSSSTTTSSAPSDSSSAASSTAFNGSAGASDSTTSTPPPPPSPFGAGAPPFGAGAAGAGAAGAATPGASGMLDMLRNPEMQKMLYPYLPEPMRNPDTFEWMLNNPEYRAQLEGMLSQQMGAGAPPAVQELMQGVDMNPDKMKEQFDALGMSPEEFIQKVMSDPELATSMTKPSVMAAIAECTQNPMNIFKYQNDEEVMKVFEKMSTLFPQAAMAGGMPGMPGMTPPVVQADFSEKKE